MANRHETTTSCNLRMFRIALSASLRMCGSSVSTGWPAPPEVAPWYSSEVSLLLGAPGTTGTVPREHGGGATAFGHGDAFSGCRSRAPARRPPTPSDSCSAHLLPDALLSPDVLLSPDALLSPIVEWGPAPRPWECRAANAAGGVGACTGRLHW